MKNVNVHSSVGWLIDRNCRHAGRIKQLDAIIKTATLGDLDKLSQLLTSERETFGLIVETPSFVVAATDRIRSFPVYLRQGDAEIEIATDTSKWINPELKNEFCEKSSKSFLAAGFTIGSETLFRTVRHLLPGEIVVVDRVSGKVLFRRYYIFNVRFSEKNHGNSEHWEGRLENALDNAIRRVIDRADGAKIWVPLSAGFDSRAILAKLLSCGYDNVETFSYGSPGNMEARVAKELAEKAGVPWRFVSSVTDHPRKDFCSKEVTRYFLFAGGLGTTPAMSEFFALKQLKRSDALAENDYVVNGQSGDFLTGGHIPQAKTFEEVTAYCLNRHFALFDHEKKTMGLDGMEKLLNGWIKRYLPEDRAQTETTDQLLSFYLTFEWQERQSQYVVQQQRAYDFLGINWALPLWDADLMDLYEQVPLGEQQNQALYLRYLSKWNYKGLFDEGRRPYDPWPKYGTFFKVLGRVMAPFWGTDGKSKAYKALYYWTDLNYQYGLFGYKTYFAYRSEIKNPVSLYALRYLQLVRRSLAVHSEIPEERHFERVFGSR